MAPVGISLMGIAPLSRGLSMYMHDAAWPSCIPGEHMVPESLSAFYVWPGYRRPSYHLMPPLRRFGSDCNG